MKKIIYDDEHIQVIHKPGASDVLIVTFGDMLSLANGKTFFAEQPSQKRNVSALGFRAKDRNWYPETSVDAAIQIIKDILSLSEKVVVYGGSMGGFAALKFSKKLCANRVYALAPQYSIDPSVIKDHRYNRYFNQDLNQNHKIAAGDLCGEIYITHDPIFKMDHQHVSRIASLGYHINIVPLRFSLHGATTILASSTFFAEVVRPDEIKKSNLYRIFKERRRSSASYIEGLSEYLSKKRYGSALRLLSASIDSGLIKKTPRVRNVISLCLQSNHKEATSAESISIMKALGVSDKCQEYKGSALVLKTAHSFFLAYDTITNKIIQTSKEAIQSFFFLRPLTVNGPCGVLSFNGEHGQSVLVQSGSDIQAIAESQEYNEKNYIVYRRTKDYFVISTSTKNLSASPNGPCSFSVEHVRDWEKFSLEKIYLA